MAQIDLASAAPARPALAERSPLRHVDLPLLTPNSPRSHRPALHFSRFTIRVAGGCDTSRTLDRPACGPKTADLLGFSPLFTILIILVL